MRYRKNTLNFFWLQRLESLISLHIACLEGQVDLKSFGKYGLYLNNIIIKFISLTRGFTCVVGAMDPYKDEYTRIQTRNRTWYRRSYVEPDIHCVSESVRSPW